MTHSNFIATQIPVDQNTGLEELSSLDKKLVSSFPVNTIFDPSKSYIELHTYSIDGTLLESNHYYTNQSFLGDSGTSGGKQAKGLTLDPVADAKIGGYEFGGIKFVYNFLDDLYSETTNKIDFFIEEISPDRTEIRLLTTKLDNDKITSYTNELKNRIDNSSYTFDLRANFNFNRLFAITNINLQEYKKENSVIVKLYEPLSEEISIKDTLVLNEIISDSVAFEIDVEVIDDVITVPYIKGPNFNLEATTQVNAPSEYFNYTDLFSFPTSNSYRELNSLFQEKSIDISIDYSDYEDFIHFSSANERLRNFKYKLELIESYQINIEKEKFKNIKEFNDKFNTNKSIGGKFQDQIIEFKGQPQELSSYVVGEQYTSIGDLDKLYVEDSILSSKFSSLDKAFMIQSVSQSDIITKSAKEKMSEYQNQTSNYNNYKPTDFSNKKFNEWQ